MNKSGQSLIEVLIAMTIMLLLLTGLVVATTQSIKNSLFARSQARATHFAQEQVEELRRIRDEEGWAEFTTQVSSCPLSLPDPEFSCAIQDLILTDDQADFKVVVSWQDRGTHQVQQRTTLSKWAY